jgi:hypothetical protein
VKDLIKFIFCVFIINSTDITKIFENIYEQNFWGDNESISGSGSNSQNTVKIRKEIPKLLKKFNIKNFIDAPCGDFYWMKFIIHDLGIDKYFGIDIVKDIIDKNQKNFSNTKINFYTKNIIDDLLFSGDLIFCRDCLVHFSYSDIIKTLKNIKKNGIKYILTTHFTKIDRKFINIETGQWRPINFILDPFNFPQPEEIIIEDCQEVEGIYNDKSLALWKLEDLNI